MRRETKKIGTPQEADLELVVKEQNNVQAEVDNLLDKIKRAKLDLRIAEENLDKSDNNIASKTKFIATLDETIEVKNKELNNLNSLIVATKKGVEAAQLEGKKAIESIKGNEARAENEALEAIKALKDKLAQLQAENSSKAIQLANTESILATKLTQIDKVYAEMETLAGSKEELKKDIDSLLDFKTLKGEELEELNDKVDDIQNEVYQGKQKLLTLGTEIKALEKQKDEELNLMEQAKSNASSYNSKMLSVIDREKKLAFREGELSELAKKLGLK